MKKLLFIMLFAVSTFSCTKSEDKTVAPDPPAVTTGTIQFVNNSYNPYYVYINGSNMGSLPGKNSVTYIEPFGTYALEVIQVSGYLVYATDLHYTGTVSETHNVIISFP